MALHLGLVSTSTSLSFLTTSLKKTYWGRSDAARIYDAQRPVLLHAPVARAAVWAGGGLAVDSLPLHVAGRHPVVDDLRHPGNRVRGGPAVAPAAAWTQQQEKVSLFPNIIVLTGPSGVCPDQLGKGLQIHVQLHATKQSSSKLTMVWLYCRRHWSTQGIQDTRSPWHCPHRWRN